MGKKNQIKTSINIFFKNNEIIFNINKDNRTELEFGLAQVLLGSWESS